MYPFRPRLPHLGHEMMDQHGLSAGFGNILLHTPYFRLRKILPPSSYSPVTYSKPVSINLQASFTLTAITV